MAADLQRHLTLPGADAAAVVEGLVRTFDGRTVINGLDLNVPRGEFVTLLGASGCGKSTLLRVLAGLDREIKGTVRVTPSRAVAFQAPRLLPWKKVWQNVALGLSSDGSRERADTALAEVGLGNLADAWPRTLSGGEAQRAALARALVRRPALLLLDEPFGALDALTRMKAQRLVADLWQRHRPSVLLVTHDVEEALLLGDRVLVMAGGVIAHQVRIEVPRPRDVGHPELLRIRAGLLAELGVGAG